MPSAIVVMRWFPLQSYPLRACSTRISFRFGCKNTAGVLLPKTPPVCFASPSDLATSKMLCHLEKYQKLVYTIDALCNIYNTFILASPRGGKSKRRRSKRATHAFSVGNCESLRLKVIFHSFPREASVATLLPCKANIIVIKCFWFFPALFEDLPLQVQQPQC